MTGRQTGNGQHGPLLTRLRRYGKLDEAAIAALHALVGAPRTLAPGFTLLSEGEPAPKLHLFLQGWACRSRLLADGARQVIEILLPGDLCDLDGLYLHGVAADLSTLTVCTLACIDAAELRALAARNPAIAHALAWLSALRSAAQAEHVVSLGRRSARERIAHLFCELFVRLAVTGDTQDHGCPCPLTQLDLGDALGLSAVHVNRVLQDMRHDGLIMLRTARLTILDWPRLRTLAQFDPTYLQIPDLTPLPAAPRPLSTKTPAPTPGN